MAVLQASPGLPLARRGVLASSRWDAIMIALAFAQGAVFILAPTLSVIALGLWWNSNTISHNFIHRPFFRKRALNLLFAAYLSVLLGIPQSLWRDRHLAHHAGKQRDVRLTCELLFEVATVLSLWAVIAARAPGFFIWVYMPGYICGLGLCALHGYYEHARGTTSHYGRLYNLLFFNDGYHVEHHARPGLHWKRLREYNGPAVRVSRWPAPLRWMETLSLETLERLVLRSQHLQRFVLTTHARAFRRVHGALSHVENVAIVGGGLFPRTALILEKLLPAARITIIDANVENLHRARGLLGSRKIDFVHGYGPFSSLSRPINNRRQVANLPYRGSYDLVVVPLSFKGDRDAIYEHPPAPVVIVHDWIWRKRGDGGIVSVALLKRINLVRR
jgi:fatty acid desaturase